MYYLGQIAPKFNEIHSLVKKVSNMKIFVEIQLHILKMICVLLPPMLRVKEAICESVNSIQKGFIVFFCFKY